MRSNEARAVRLRLYCRPDGYTWAQVNWGSEAVSAQGTELAHDSGETYAIGHSVDVRFDDGESRRETWWLRNGEYSLVRQAYSRGAHSGFIRELRQADAMTVWVNTESDALNVDFDVRNLDYALSRQPEHCREPDALGKWVWDEWETGSGKASYSIFLYPEGSHDMYVSIYCRGDEPDNRSVQFDWGERRPAVPEDTYEIKRSDGTLHSSSHPVKVRYGSGVTQTESWQLSARTSSNRSFTQAFIGSGRGWISRLTQVDMLTVATDAESGETIRAEFDVRRLDQALARMDQHCR